MISPTHWPNCSVISLSFVEHLWVQQSSYLAPRKTDSPKQMRLWNYFQKMHDPRVKMILDKYCSRLYGQCWYKQLSDLLLCWWYQMLVSNETLTYPKSSHPCQNWFFHAWYTPSRPGKVAFERDCLQFARDVATVGQLFEADQKSEYLALVSVKWDLARDCLNLMRKDSEVGGYVSQTMSHSNGT